MNETAALEALLFAAGEPLTKEKIAELMELGVIEVSNLLRQLNKDLSNHGIILREVADGYQLSTRPEYFEIVERLATIVNSKLSTSMLETLSIIAFMQPVTRVDIEEVRGVKVDRILTRLIEFDLIEEVGRKQVLGRPILYGTTENFLRTFGLKSLNDLPQIK